MSAFSRSFPTDVLAAWSAKYPGNAVSLIFNLWALPGHKATTDKPLRLALRDGYLNFFVKGQLVAKLSCGAVGPRLSVPKPYVTGRQWKGVGRPAAEQTYEDFDAAALADPGTCALVAGWIATAESYACAEKRFIEDLIAANAGIVDFKTSLAVSGFAGSKRPARLDVAIAQSTGGGSASIAFWEVKCANNGDLRPSTMAGTGPKVLTQVEKYVRWMEEGRRTAQVGEAYRNAAMTLLALDRQFCGNGAGQPASVSIWGALARTSKPAVVVQPGLAIGNYCPEGNSVLETSDKMKQCAISFARNGHPAALERQGVRFHEIGPEHNGPELPYLPVTIQQAPSRLAGQGRRRTFA